VLGWNFNGLFLTGSLGEKLERVLEILGVFWPFRANFGGKNSLFPFKKVFKGFGTQGTSTFFHFLGSGKELPAKIFQGNFLLFTWGRNFWPRKFLDRRGYFF